MPVFSIFLYFLLLSGSVYSIDQLNAIQNAFLRATSVTQPAPNTPAPVAPKNKLVRK